MAKRKKHPDELTGPAADAWLLFLSEIGSEWNPKDRAALTVLCSAWAEMWEAEKHVGEHGLIVKLPNSYPAPSPYLKVRDAARATVVSLLKEFALTPNSRSRIKLPSDKKDEDDDLEF